MQESGPWDPSSGTGGGAGPEEALPIKSKARVPVSPPSLPLHTHVWATHNPEHIPVGLTPRVPRELGRELLPQAGLPSLRHSLPSGGWPTLSKEVRQPKATGPCSLSSGLAGVLKLEELVTAESR